MQTESSRAEPPKRKRRWYQFRLRTLMIGVTLLAVACAFVGSDEKLMRSELAALSGRWNEVSEVEDGREKRPAFIDKRFLVIKGTQLLSYDGARLVSESNLQVDPKAEPKILTVEIVKGDAITSPIGAIYKIDGETLTICVKSKNSNRPPATFKGSGGFTLITYLRAN